MLDEEFAQAYAGLARTFADVLLYGIDNLVLGPVARDAAYKAASKAVELEPGLARPWSVLAIVQMVDGEYANAVDSAHRAVALSPNDAEAHINLALVLGVAGDIDGAVKAIDTALRLNPKPPPGFLIIAGLTSYLDRNYEKASTLLEQARKYIPNSMMILEFLTMALFVLDNIVDIFHEKFFGLQSLQDMMTVFNGFHIMHIGNPEQLSRLFLSLVGN